MTLQQQEPHQQKQVKSHRTQSDSQFQSLQKSNKQTQFQPKLRQFTQLKNIHEYLNFYKQYSAKSKINNQTIQDYSNDINLNSNLSHQLIINQLQQIQNDIQNLSQQILQKNKNQYGNLQILKILHKFQSYHQEQIFKLLYRSNKFIKVQSFTEKLIVNVVHCSKNYQVIKLQLHLLSYKTFVNILNQPDHNFLAHNTQTTCSGSYGSVHFLSILNEKLAVKCLPFVAIKQQIDKDFDSKIDNKFLQNVLKQFFFISLFSQIQIGPNVKTIGAFDLILCESCIIFGTEICSSMRNQSNQVIQICKNLFSIHMLQVVHRDIKPGNIMYSETYKKNIFIDFGCTEVLNEKLGQKTFTKFMGTTTYCSQQLVLLLSKKETSCAVDLYFNDIYGLRKSINENSMQQTCFQINNSSQQINEAYQFFWIKFLLYNRNFKVFKKIWRQFRKNHYECLDQYQIKLLTFCFELKPCSQLRNIYLSEIDESIRQMIQFKQLQILFKRQDSQLYFYLSENEQKKRRYQQYKVIYKKIDVCSKQYRQDENCIQLILISKQRVQSYLYKIINRYIESQNVPDRNQIIKIMIIGVHYCTIFQIYHNVTIQDKIKICDSILNIINKFLSNQIRTLHLMFECPFNHLKSISIFYQFFLQQIFTELPLKFKSECLIKSISTLCFLGLPTTSIHLVKYIDYLIIRDKNQSLQHAQLINLQSTQLSYQNQAHQTSKLFNNEIFSDIFNISCVTMNGSKPQSKQKINASKKLSFQNIKSQFSRQDKKEQIARIQKIILIWQVKMIFLLFDNVYFNQRKTTFLLNFDKQQKIYIDSIIHKIIMPQQQNQNEFLFINQEFFFKIIGDYFNFDQQRFKLLYKCLTHPKFIKLKLISHQIKRWTLIIEIFLCYFANLFKLKDISLIRNKILMSEIFEIEGYKIILPFLIYFSTQNTSKSVFCIDLILQKINKKINQKILSLRYKLPQRFQKALQSKKFQTLCQLTQIMQSEIQQTQTQSNYQRDTTYLLQVIEYINNFFTIYLRQIPRLNKQGCQLFTSCLKIYKICLQVGIKCSRQRNNIVVDQIIKKCQDSLIQPIQIIKRFKQQGVKRTFFKMIISVGMKYDLVIKTLNKQQKYQEATQQNLSFKDNEMKQYYVNKIHLQQKYITFINELNQNIYKSWDQWTTAISQKQVFKNKIKGNRNICVAFIDILVLQRNTPQHTYRINELIQQLFQQLTIKDFQQNSKLIKLPSCQLYCGYIITNLIITKFDNYWCEQNIQFFLFCFKKGIISELLQTRFFICSIFYSSIYTKKSFKQIQEYLIIIADGIKKSPTKRLIKYVRNSFRSLFWCRCQNCFYRDPGDWDFNAFTQYLSQNINMKNEIQNIKPVSFISLLLQYAQQIIKEKNEAKIYKFLFQINAFYDTICKKCINGQIIFLCLFSQRLKTF